MKIVALFLCSLMFANCGLSTPIPESSSQTPVITKMIELRGHVQSAVLSPVSTASGILLAVATDEAVELWTISAHKVTQNDTLPYHTLAQLIPDTEWGKGMRVRLAFSPDGAILAIGGVPRICPNRSCSAHGVVYRWNVQIGTILAPLVSEPRYNSGQANVLRFRPDGKALTFVFNLNNAGCSRTADYAISWDVQSGNHLFTFEAAIIYDAVFSPDSSLTALSRSAGCTPDVAHVALMEPGFGEIKSTTYSPSENEYLESSSLVFNPNGQSLVVSIRMGEQVGSSKLYVLDAHTLQERVMYHLDHLSIESIAFSPDGKVLLIGDDKGQLHFLDFNKGEELSAVNAHPSGISDMALSQNGKFLVTVSEDGSARLWEINFR